MAAARWSLAEIVTRLRVEHGAQASPPTEDVLGLVLWENVAYLTSDAKRRAAFERLRDATELDASRIAALSDDELRAIVAAPGSLADIQMEKLRAIAALTREETGGTLESIREMPRAAAKKALRRYPAVGEPGADKILLFSGTAAVFTLESNGLRVLVRCGFGEQMSNYGKMLQSVLMAAAEEAPRKMTWMREAHLLLHRHGQATCTLKLPACGTCPLRTRCPASSV